MDLSDQGTKRDHLTVIVENFAIRPNVLVLRLDAPFLALEARPGQFVMIRVSSCLDPLLRRPFSINAVHDSKHVDIVYRVVGKGTELLSRKDRGDLLDVLGPLGTGFSHKGGSPALLVAGGMGIAPLVFFSEYSIRAMQAEKIRMLIGARTREEILFVRELESMGVEVNMATEDGSLGRRGLVTDLMTDDLMAGGPALYCCGPYAMVRAVARTAVDRGLSCQVSLESSMGCGLGACLGCVVETVEGRFARVCKEGPVFNADRVVWK